MKHRNLIFTIVLLLIGFGAGYWAKSNQSVLFSQQAVTTEFNSESNSHLSPYIGEEIRGIKSLSQAEVEGLLTGKGTPLGGMAKLAELNGYPGPRHVLDMTEELGLTAEQTNRVNTLYEEMRTGAIELGEQIIDQEKQLSNAFADNQITETGLQSGIENSALLYAGLRFLHLKYHLAMMDVLTDDQVQQYSQLRGYTGTNDPCASIPEGHDPELWKMHNNCT